MYGTYIPYIIVFTCLCVYPITTTRYQAAAIGVALLRRCTVYEAFKMIRNTGRQISECLTSTYVTKVTRDRMADKHERQLCEARRAMQYRVELRVYSCILG